AVKSLPGKKLEALGEKAGGLWGTAKDKFKPSKLGQKLKAGEEKLLEWKEKGKNRLQEIGNKFGLSSDKNKHKAIGEKIRNELKKKANKNETFEEFYARKTKECEALKNQYQPQLEKGINLDIKFKPVGEDKKDNDLDVTVRIAPNDYEIKFEIEGQQDHARFKKLLYKALEKVAAESYSGGKASSFSDDKKPIAQEDFSPEARARREAEEREKHAEIQSKEDEILKEKSKRIHEKISAAQRKYANACKAEFVPQNTFGVGSGEFFVETASNYYIVPKEEGITNYFYAIGGSKPGEVLDSIISTIGKLRYSEEEKEKDKAKISALKSGLSNPAKYLDILNFIKNPSLNNKGLNITIKNDYGKKKSTIALPSKISSKYSYESAPLPPNEAKDWYKTFPDRVTNDEISVTFIASLVAEPARWSVSHITNMLLLDKRSNLNNDSNVPPKQMTLKEKEKVAKGEYKSSEVYEHMSMTQTASDPHGDTAKKAVNKGVYSTDKDIETYPPNLNPIKNVTDRDFEAIKKNPSLVSGLEEYYRNNSGNEETTIINEFSKRIKEYLELSIKES
ncbi:hypothetical protein QUB56_35765, partial [Microcoleus sp. AR_TQ3_B6]|uniref:hypothetical protein n=1 Tax=Microcoleus sp. AR_TQ3_B6 TaxID=3055284 RepID=UPI002FCEBCCC